MKRLMIILMVLVMVFTFALPCIAVEEDCDFACQMQKLQNFTVFSDQMEQYQESNETFTIGDVSIDFLEVFEAYGRIYLFIEIDIDGVIYRGFVNGISNWGDYELHATE